MANPVAAARKSSNPDPLSSGPLRLTSLPYDIATEICVRLHTFRDITSFLLADKRVYNMFKSNDQGGAIRFSEISGGARIEAQPLNSASPTKVLDYLRSIDKPRLRAFHVRMATNTLPEEDASGTRFVLDSRRKTVAASLLAPRKTANEDVIQEVRDILEISKWSEWEIDDIPALAIEAVGNDRGLARDALTGLWTACSKWEPNTKRLEKLAVGICSRMVESMNPPSTSLLTHIVCSDRLKNSKGLFAKLELAKLGGKLARLENEKVCAKQFKRLLDTLPHLEARSKEELLPYLTCFAGIQPDNSDMNKKGMQWLAKTIALAASKGATQKEISDAIPKNLLSQAGRNYIVEKSIAGKFSFGRLREIEVKKRGKAAQ